jgi:hypothetical protein
VIALDDDVLAKARAGEGGGEPIEVALISTSGKTAGELLKGNNNAQSMLTVRLELVKSDADGSGLSKPKTAAPSDPEDDATVAAPAAAAAAAAASGAGADDAAEPVNPHAGTLCVSGLMVQDLPKEGMFGGSADPYVKVRAGKVELKTNPAADASSVQWKGVAKMKQPGVGPTAHAAGQPDSALDLWLDVMDKNTMADKLIGSACVPLRDVLAAKEQRGKWSWFLVPLRSSGKPIMSGKKAGAPATVIRVALSFVKDGSDFPAEPEWGRDGEMASPQSEVLKVKVVSASDLPSEGGFMGGKQDVFAVVTLAGTGEASTLTQSVQTKVVSNSNDPVWDEEFDLFACNVGAVEQKVIVRLMDKDRTSAADPIANAEFVLDAAALRAGVTLEGELTSELAKSAGKPLKGNKGAPSKIKVQFSIA